MQALPTILPEKEGRRVWCRLLLLTFILHPLSFVLSGCSRAPQTAEELQQRLPTQYQGELHLQGETEAHRIVIEPRGLHVRDAHHLEFNQVRYQFFTGGSITGQGDADIRGVVSTPGLDIRLEAVNAGEGSGDALKLSTFQGHLSQDLQQADATWTTGFGQGVKLKAKAAQ